MRKKTYILVTVRLLFLLLDMSAQCTCLSPLDVSHATLKALICDKCSLEGQLVHKLISSQWPERYLLAFTIRGLVSLLLNV